MWSSAIRSPVLALLIVSPQNYPPPPPPHTHTSRTYTPTVGQTYLLREIQYSFLRVLSCSKFNGAGGKRRLADAYRRLNDGAIFGQGRCRRQPHDQRKSFVHFPSLFLPPIPRKRVRRNYCNVPHKEVLLTQLPGGPQTRRVRTS